MITKRCSVEGCTQKPYGKGLCNPHYKQEWNQLNKTKLAAKRVENAQARKAYNKAWEERNREARKLYNRQRRATNKEHYRLLKQSWIAKNKEHVKRYEKEYNSSTKGRALRNAKNAHRRACRRAATPRWVCLDALKRIFLDCPKSYTVDHIIPLKNELVCGLHVPWNLQYLTGSENSIKINKFDGTYENESWRTGLNYED